MNTLKTDMSFCYSEFPAYAFVAQNSSNKRTYLFVNVFIPLYNCSILKYIKHYSQDRHSLLELDVIVRVIVYKIIYIYHQWYLSRQGIEFARVNIALF